MTGTTRHWTAVQHEQHQEFQGGLTCWTYGCQPWFCCRTWSHQASTSHACSPCSVHWPETVQHYFLTDNVATTLWNTPYLTLYTNLKQFNIRLRLLLLENHDHTHAQLNSTKTEKKRNASLSHFCYKNIKNTYIPISCFSREDKQKQDTNWPTDTNCNFIKITLCVEESQNYRKQQLKTFCFVLLFQSYFLGVQISAIFLRYKLTDVSPSRE